MQTYWAKEREKDEIVEFIDYVFSKAHRPHDFETMLPRLYGARGDGAKNHVVIREGGRIAATAAAYPSAMRIGGRRLLGLGVGMVAVHPRFRGRGYMRPLMDAVDARAEELGADFAVLSGERQRYAYFGYHYGGYQMNAALTPSNVRHALRDTGTTGLEIAELTDADVSAALSLMERQPCFFERRADEFLDCLRAWHNRPFAVKREGRFIGYGTLRQNPDRCHIAELLLEDERDFPAAMKLLSARHGKLSICAAPWQKERAAFLSAVCADFSIGPCHAWKIYDEENVRSALLQLHGGEGEFAFGGFALPLPLYIAPPDSV